MPPVRSLPQALRETGFLPDGSVMLDLGCGSFPHLPLGLLMSGFRGRYIGVDWSEGSMAKCRQRWQSVSPDKHGLEVEWRHQDAWSLPDSLYSGAVVLVHGTPPRTKHEGALVMPKSEDELGQVALKLMAKGPAVCIIYLNQELSERLCVGAHKAGLHPRLLVNVWSGGIPPMPWGVPVVVSTRWPEESIGCFADDAVR